MVKKYGDTLGDLFKYIFRQVFFRILCQILYKNQRAHKVCHFHLELLAPRQGDTLESLKNCLGIFSEIYDMFCIEPRYSYENMKMFHRKLGKNSE